MKLPKVSMRLILRSAIVAIVIVQVLLWVLLLWGPRLELELYGAIQWGLFVIVPILQIGCLLFFVRDIYIHGIPNKHPRVTAAAAGIVMIMALWWVLVAWTGQLHGVLGIGLFLIFLISLIGCLLFFAKDIYIDGVTKKHPRATIAARVLGALGASWAFVGFLGYPFSPMGVLMSLIAIRGVKLALARPKVAGVLMLLAGIMPWIVVSLLWVFGRLIVYELQLQPDDMLFAVMMGLAMPVLTLPASLLLIPGGAAALLSARRKWQQERLSS